MTWKTIFQNYQTRKNGKIGKITTPNFPIFPNFPVLGEIQKSNNACTQTQILEKVDMEKLKSFLGEDWDDYKNNPELLIRWADLLFNNQLMERGEIPNNFTAITNCKLCGYVYVPPALVNGGSVLGCPWCWNRVKKIPIPKPVNTH